MKSTEELIDSLLKKEDALSLAVKNVDLQFSSVEYLFQWRNIFQTGLRNLLTTSKAVSRAKNPGKSLILSSHRNVRLNFHCILQIPYIIYEHFEDQIKNETLIGKDPVVKKLWGDFSSSEVFRLLFMLRHKVVHETLLDEYVTLVRPVDSRHYLEITLPEHTIKVLTTPNLRGKSTLGSSEDYFVQIFTGGRKGFLFLFRALEKELCCFEKELNKHLKVAFSADYKKKRSLLMKRNRLRKQMKKHGVIFIEE